MGWGFIAGMEFTDYMLWKAGAMVLAAFVWGVYCGLTGRELSGEPEQPKDPKDPH